MLLLNKLKLNRKAQVFLEYAVLVAILAAALVGMQIYMKRAVQGKYRQLGDDLGPQYSPKTAAAVINVSTPLGLTDTQQQLGWLKDADNNYVLDSFDLRVLAIESNTNIVDEATRDGTETVGAFEAGLFD